MKNEKELKEILKILDLELYDELSDYEKGAKDILNYIFCPENVDDDLIEHFKKIKEN